ncbi:MAG: SusC/RagA family TonB-linked outer membrane protein, partial [Bacteroidia bacterium]|nr:SusC/RagA family TonB-linked outer membrane protein [Bacteroidia bacterium]
RSLNAPFLESQRYGRPNQEISRTIEGQPIATFWGWQANGLYQSQSEIDSDPGLTNDPRREEGLILPGDVRFVDLDGNGQIDDRDRTVLGSPHPDVVYGLQASASYKGFDLTLFFIGEAGKDIYNADRMQGLDASYPFNLYDDVISRWNGPGTSNSIPRLTVDRNNLNHRTSDLFIEDGGFFRLKNLTIGYTLPNQYTSKVGIASARFYITGQNVFTVTDYTGIDPELGYIGNNLQLGVDYAQYPQARTWIFGVTLDF